MSEPEKFEDLPLWQEAALLYNKVVDLLEEHGVALTPTFRTALDRAALSVLNNVAAGFERETPDELRGHLAAARRSADEVRSMMAVVKDRPRLGSHAEHLQEIRSLAESCALQLAGWMGSVEHRTAPGEGHAAGGGKLKRESEKAREFRRNFLRNLTPEHPLYHSDEARAAREEPGTKA